MYSFPNLEPVCCSMSGSNCCFLSCIQVSQRQVRWSEFHLFKNVTQFVMLHSEAEVDFFFFLIPLLFDDPADVGNLISDSSAFSKSSLYI